MSSSKTLGHPTAALRRSGAGDRALVFVHGFLDAAAVWDDVVARLDGRRTEFIRVDLAGMGERAGDDGPYSLDRFAADVAALAETIDKPVVLVGQSMGAQVAELVAARLPRHVSGLVLLTPIPLAGSGLPGDAIARFRSLGGQADAQRAVRRQLAPHLGAADLERLVAIGALARPAAVAAFADAWNGGHADGRQPSRYDGPVLVVRGEEDPFVTVELVSAAVVPRFGRATTATVRHAGHWPHVEQPQAVAEMLAAFLDAIDAPGANTAGRVQPQGWTQAFAKKDAGAFAQAFAADVTLEASVLARPVQGVDRVKTVMAAASRIYESLAFTHEATNGPRTYLEWEARAFGAMALRGITVLTKNDAGAIAHIAIHHRPLGAALRFSVELGERVRADIDASHFHQAPEKV